MHVNDSELIFGLMAAFGCQEYSFEELKGLIEPFNVTETSLRTNLSRMIKNNVLSSRKEGKSAFYSLGKKGGNISSNVSFSFKKLDWSQWDGSWWGILFTVPNMEKAQRHSIRKKLLAYRFTNLYPGFWIRPLHPKEKIEMHLETLINNEYCTLIRFDFFREITNEEISRIWRLDEVMHSFEAVIETVREHLDRAQEYTPEEGLKYKLLVGNKIVNALFADPMLPDEFLPSHWKGDELRTLFRDFDSTMTDIARPYVNKIINAKL